MMRKVALGCLLLASASVASATTTFVANGTAGGLAIDAKAEFTFSTNLLTLTLTNLLGNPTSVGQNITDFEFTVASTSTGTLKSANVPELINIAGNGSFSSAGTNVDPGWAFAFSAGNFSLNGLAGSNNPAYSIIGPPGSGPAYSNANGSIAGNGAHNPFISQTATWVFNISDPLGTALPITHVIFSFNTTAGDDFSCDLNGGCMAIPEPGSWVLMSAGLGLLGLMALRFRSARS